MTITTRQTSGVGVTSKNAPLTNAELDQNFIDLANGNFAQIQQSTVYPRASVRPSLLLDFSNTKQLDPRITFSRPTTATYYDGKTAVKAEENLLTYSQEFDNAVWSKGWAVTVISNTATAPDGTSTADSAIETTVDYYHYLRNQNGVYLAAGSTYTWSIFAKANTRSWLIMDAFDNNNNRTAFDLVNGVVGVNAYGNTASIISVGNGWYRCTITRLATTTSTVGYLQAGPHDGNNTSTYTGDGTSGIYLWGAQIEQRSSVSSYTPTTSSAITNYIPVLQTAVSNDARFDHDPVTGESKGLLIEEQRTNLLTYSQEFDNAAWGKENVTVATNTVVAPDGTLTGDKLIGSTATGFHGISQSVSFATGSLSYTIYAKAAEKSVLRIDSTDFSTGNARASFNLNNGTVTNTFSNGSWSALSASATSIGNGWYRCVMTVTKGAGSSASFNIYIDGVSYTGDGYSGIYIWGAQLEAGSFPTSYIPTVASQVTRSADSASMTGSNFSSWFNDNEGTVYCGFDTASLVPTQAYWSIDNGSRFGYQIRKVNAALQMYQNWDGNYFNCGAITANSHQQTVFTYNNTAGALSFAGTFNGAAVTNGTPQTVSFASTTLRLGNYSGSYQMTGHIRKFAYYPKRLSNSELQAITS